MRPTFDYAPVRRPTGVEPPVREPIATSEAEIEMRRVTVIDGPLPPGVFQAADTEPHPVTAPEHLPVLRELMDREPLFHRPEFGTTRADFERMTAAEFWEVGASGRRYGRQFCLETLEKRYQIPTEDVWEVGDFHCLEVAADNYLLTYTLLQGVRTTRRATIWRRTPAGWQVVYHQGTAVEGGPTP